MKAQFVFVLLVLSLCANAQSDYIWEKYLNEVMSAEDMESAEWEDSYDSGVSLSLWLDEVVGGVAYDPFAGL